MSRRGSQVLRLLSYNIHGCVGRGGREDPDGILEIIRDADADFVALQEVQDNDIADLSFLRGLESLPYAETIYGKTMNKPVGAYGNLLLSKQPLTAVECLDISHRKREPRGIIFARSEAFPIPVHVMSTHFGLRRKERAEQIRQLLEFREAMIKDKTGCLDILMGDMNEWTARSRNLRKLINQFAFFSMLRTFPAWLPLFALDQILVNGPVKSVDFRRIDSPLARLVSDHRPLLAEISLKA